MKIIALITGVLLISACSTKPIYFTNARGETGQCGPYTQEGSGAHAFQEQNCIEAYLRSGWKVKANAS